MNYSKLAQSVEKSVFYFSDGFNRFGNRVDFVGFGHIALFLAQAFGIQRLDIFHGFAVGGRTEFFLRDAPYFATVGTRFRCGPQADFVVIKQNTFGKGLHVGIGSAAADAAADTVVALVNCLIREITAEIVDFPFADFDVGKVGITCFFGDYVVELGGNGGLGARH